MENSMENMQTDLRVKRLTGHYKNAVHTTFL